LKRPTGRPNGSPVKTTSELPARARKRFGQHFLEPAWVTKVVAAIDPAATDTFLEIGPGRGALTAPLAARADRVVAVEIDRRLAFDLRRAAIPNLTVVEGDFLKLTPSYFRGLLAEPPPGATRLRVAGNLPYNVGTPILLALSRLYEAGLPVVDATLMLQREVAARLVASPGTKDYGVLTILAGRRASAELVLSLPPGAFRPRPQVHSALVRLRFRDPEPVAADEQEFQALVKAIFTRRRKTIANALLAFPGTGRWSPTAALRAAGLDPTDRPEALTTTDLVRLSDVLQLPPPLSGGS
jgi:16S rRNA (adenine1518-N6/adenine1519-N6)-dimethyltransferase